MEAKPPSSLISWSPYLLLTLMKLLPGLDAACRFLSGQAADGLAVGKPGEIDRLTQARLQHSGRAAVRAEANSQADLVEEVLLGRVVVLGRLRDEENRHPFGPAFPH